MTTVGIIHGPAAAPAGSRAGRRDCQTSLPPKWRGWTGSRMCGARLLAQLICRSADRNILAHGQTFTSLHAHCVQYPRRWFALVLSIKEATHEPRAGQHCTLPNLNYGARVRPKACQARAPPRPGPRFTPRRGCHSSCHLAHGSNESAVRRWSAMHHGDYIGCRRCPLRMRTCACPMTGCGVRSPGPVRGRFSPGRYPRVRSSSEGVRGAGGEVLRSSLS